MHVFRWDLDRTYLDTDIHSVRGMVRAALEDATEKRHVPGAGALLRALLDVDPQSAAAILSGSPTQMRAVLTRRLELDGIRVESLVLKDNLGNIRRGRLRAVRGQLGYKLPHLLAQRLGRRPEDTEHLFGDDAEVDALVYALYAETIAGRVDAATLQAVLEAGDAYPDQIEHALRSFAHLTPADAVQGIFIHADRALPGSLFERLGPRVIVVHSWLQAAGRLLHEGRLDLPRFDDVARATIRQDALDDQATVALVQDAVRRGVFPDTLARRLAEDSSALAHLRPAIDAAILRLGGARRTPAHPLVPDWLGFLRAATDGDLAGRPSRR